MAANSEVVMLFYLDPIFGLVDPPQPAPDPDYTILMVCFLCALSIFLVVVLVVTRQKPDVSTGNHETDCEEDSCPASAAHSL